ncbi:MAG: hypothetical protein DRQ55_12635 [Planctomycetota bacterium]|nr:MAG: hypothetical protein DRQ55_12635 [Planctomycetota bacterium]
MRASPGGQLPIDEIHGRDAFIAELWRTLETNSIRLEAERRVGKTHVLNKMEGEPSGNWEVIKLDLEEVHSAIEFAERIGGAVHQRLTGWKKKARRIGDVLAQYGGGGKVGPLRFPRAADRPSGYWKTLLTSAINDLVEQQAQTGKRVVFLLDEMPWMIAAIAERDPDGEHAAMEVLDVLRRLRQSTATGAGFRMVLCGSVGMHHALASLREKGHRNQPVNDMVLVEVPPLEPRDARELAARLLDGEGFCGDRDGAVAAHIATVSGCFPYYIHWIVSRLRSDDRSATIADVDAVLQWMLTAPHDPCSLRHFRDRIGTYYPGDERTALALLDHAAATEGPIETDEFVNVAKSVGDVDAQATRDLLRLLAVDHYLARGDDGRYRFRHALLRRWWRLERGLA